MLEPGIYSEVQKAKTVLIHHPGAEVENMTPETAERALYSDILNLSIATSEYDQFKGILNKVTHVVEVKELLTGILKNDNASKQELASKFQSYAGLPGIYDQLMSLSVNQLADKLIEGVALPQLSLVNFLLSDKYSINPLHNMFYMRDASFVIGNTVFISSMARTVRKAETILLNFIYRHSFAPSSNIHILNTQNDPSITIEGGDVMVVSPEVLIIGIGSRTTALAVDKLIQIVSEQQHLKHVLIQELPHEPESFIHLDMVFTLISDNECMIYKPVILEESRYHTIHMRIDKGETRQIRYIPNLLEGLKTCGFDFKPVFCGGGDGIYQEREQWHSGANFFAFEQAKIIGYARNKFTNDVLSKNGYEVLTANEVIKGTRKIDETEKCVITIEGSELARGGGGARCMTMPLLRG